MDLFKSQAEKSKVAVMAMRYFCDIKNVVLAYKFINNC